MISEVSVYGNNRFGCIGGGDVWPVRVVMAAATVWGTLTVVEGIDMDWGRCGIRGDGDGVAVVEVRGVMAWVWWQWWE